MNFITVIKFKQYSLSVSLEYMYIFESQYIVFVNSIIKHYNTFKSNIDYKYQNSNITFIEIQYTINTNVREYTQC